MNLLSNKLLSSDRALVLAEGLEAILKSQAIGLETIGNACSFNRVKLGASKTLNTSVKASIVET